MLILLHEHRERHWQDVHNKCEKNQQKLGRDPRNFKWAKTEGR